MSRFNATVSTRTKTTNRAGGEAYDTSPELKMVSILLTSFANDQFYRSATDTFKELKTLLKEVDPLFAAKSAIYARTEFGMRSISHVLAAELGPYASGSRWAKRFYDKIVYRPDDMIEIISYLKSQKQKLPHALIRGFAEAFQKFDAYQLAKYRAENKDIKLVDVVNMVHPIANENISALVKGTLKSTETWEAKLTKAGQQSETKEQKKILKKEAWTELLESGRIGYMALLKNLRNIIEQAPDMVNRACELLVEQRRIEKSLVLPFRYTTAIKELYKINGSRQVVVALNHAAELACMNVPDFPGKTVIAVDVSGSMVGKPEEIARLFVSVLYKALDSVLITFDTRVEICNLNPTDGVLSLMNQIRFRGGGTNFNIIFDSIAGPVDRVIILSDMQAWHSGSYYRSNPKEAFDKYKKRTGANPHVYSFDLQGYGSLQFPENNVYCLSGFHERIFDLMKLLEKDKNALINTIKGIEI